MPKAMLPCREFEPGTHVCNLDYKQAFNLTRPTRSANDILLRQQHTTKEGTVMTVARTTYRVLHMI